VRERLIRIQRARFAGKQSTKKNGTALPRDIDGTFFLQSKIVPKQYGSIVLKQSRGAEHDSVLRDRAPVLLNRVGSNHSAASSIGATRGRTI
jgi:hypothetical protein